MSRSTSTTVISTARALAETFVAICKLGISDRRMFDAILRETLAQNPQYLGVWSVLEPNAMGPDAQYENAPGHDEHGRFIPLWHRGSGAIHMQPNLGYDVPGFGDWYLLPKQSQTETVLEPYEYPFDGEPQFITSQVAPIMHRGVCVGVAGVDVAVRDLVRPEAMQVEETFQRGYIFLNERGQVDYWSERTRELLGRYIGRKLRGGELPAAIAGHVQRLRRQGRRAELPALRRGGTVLRLRFAQQPRSRRFLITVEEQSGGPVAELTKREREIVEWLGQGKSNAEIGIILGISIHTVKRHVEHVLEKLGAENRFAAALVGLQAT